MTSRRFYLPAVASAAIILPLILCGPAGATTWAEAQKQDPITGGKCRGREIASYGSYIYNWPSKYDLVFWPLTDRNYIAFCPESGYAAFNENIDKMSDDEKKGLAEWLKKNYDKSAKPAQDLQSLDWLEKLYSQRNMDSDFWSLFHRLQAYMAYEDNDPAKSHEYVIKALQLLQKKLDSGPKDFALLETLYLLGEYNRRLGNQALAKDYFAKARAAEYTDEDGSKKKGHPYFLELIGDSESVIDKPNQRPERTSKGAKNQEGQSKE